MAQADAEFAIPGLGGGSGPSQCGVPEPVNYQYKVHIFDTSTVETVTHHNMYDGDHVSVSKRRKRRDY